MGKSTKNPPTPIAPDEIRSVKRKIHYYELRFKFEEGFNPRQEVDDFQKFFSIIANIASNKEGIRYQPAHGDKIFMQDVKFKDSEKKITGKLRYIKSDVFPEIIDLITDETADIETSENQGLVDTTHFVIDYSKATKKIAIEYNHTGAKFADFINYCQQIGSIKKAIKNARYSPITKDELASYKKRIGSCSKMVVRIHKDNIPAIESLDDKLYSTIQSIKEQFSAEYVELRLKFSYRKIKTRQPIFSSISHLLTGLVKNKNKIDLFETLQINALDQENNFKMRLFDLLIDRIESNISVQRKPKHNVIISADILEKMKDEMRSKKI